MTAAQMPMFPLGSVLFPGQLLPLHIFESRYQEMLARCLSGDREFGVVLIEQGAEVGGGDVRAGVGTVASILDASQVVAGHWAVMTVGVRRIRISRWQPDDPWPNALVEDMPDESPLDVDDLDSQWAAVQGDFYRVQGLADRLTGNEPGVVEYDDDPATGSFHLAALSPLGAFDRQRVLATEGVRNRLDMLARVFGEIEETLLAQLAFGGELDL